MKRFFRNCCGLSSCCAKDDDETGDGSNPDEVDSQETQNLVLTRTWTLSLFPVAAAVFVLFVAYGTASKGIMLQPGLEGNFSSKLTNVQRTSESAAIIISDMLDEGENCDSLFGPVRFMFAGLFITLKRSLVEQINAYVLKTSQVFTTFDAITITGVRYVFLVPPSIAVVLFGIAFVLTISSCCNRAKWMVGFLHGAIMTLVYLSISINFFIISTLNYMIDTLPLLHITVVFGPLMYMSMSASALLFVAYVQIWIGSTMPIQ